MVTDTVGMETKPLEFDKESVVGDVKPALPADPKTAKLIKLEALVKTIDDKHPDLYAAIQQFTAGFKQTMDGWRGLAISIRKAELPDRDAIAYLKYRGFTKVQISKIRTVADAPKEVFDKYIDGGMGFNPTLEAARDAKNDGKKKVSGKFPKTLSDCIHSCIGDFKGPWPKRPCVARIDLSDPADGNQPARFEIKLIPVKKPF